MNIVCMSSVRTRIFPTESCKMNKKLIIWDFDGVISDTEHLWIRNWQILLKKNFGVEWDFETAKNELAGLSPKSKIELLHNKGIFIDDKFLQDLRILDWEIMNTEMKAVPEVEEILKNKNIKQCIATGGNLDKTEKKLEILNFKQYFSDNHVFTAQMVEKGKPEPDLFLLAAKSMGEEAKDCVVVEDAIPGLKAAQRAGMVPVAFIGCPMTNTVEYRDTIKNMGIEFIFDKMRDLKIWLEDK